MRKIKSFNLTFKKRKIGKSGDHYFITIPKLMIDSDLINPEKKYTIVLIEEPEEIKDNKPAEVSAQ